MAQVMEAPVKPALSSGGRKSSSDERATYWVSFLATWKQQQCLCRRFRKALSILRRAFPRAFSNPRDISTRRLFPPFGLLNVPRSAGQHLSQEWLFVGRLFQTVFQRKTGSSAHLLARIYQDDCKSAYSKPKIASCV